MKIHHKDSTMKMILFFMTSLGMANVSAESLKLVKCQNQKIVRFLEIQKSDEGPGCETIYTKDGVSKTEGKGLNNDGCQLILGNIQKNLEAAHWKCSDVSKNAVVVE